jgi:hypothetical protein
MRTKSLQTSSVPDGAEIIPFFYWQSDYCRLARITEPTRTHFLKKEPCEGGRFVVSYNGGD